MQKTVKKNKMECTPVFEFHLFGMDIVINLNSFIYSVEYQLQMQFIVINILSSEYRTRFFCISYNTITYFHIRMIYLTARPHLATTLSCFWRGLNGVRRDLLLALGQGVKGLFWFAEEAGLFRGAQVPWLLSFYSLVSLSGGILFCSKVRGPLPSLQKRHDVLYWVLNTQRS